MLQIFSFLSEPDETTYFRFRFGMKQGRYQIPGFPLISASDDTILPISFLVSE